MSSDQSGALIQSRHMVVVFLSEPVDQEVSNRNQHREDEECDCSKSMERMIDRKVENQSSHFLLRLE